MVRRDGGGFDGLHDPALPGKLAADPHHLWLPFPCRSFAALLFLYLDGQTLNTMTLGGFALAVGILVDNATVVIENIERNLSLGHELVPAIEVGSAEILKPTLVSTIAICVVFVPVFLLQGTAKYLFSPLSLSVITSLLASLVLSFTLVPVLFKMLMKAVDIAVKHGKRGGGAARHYGPRTTKQSVAGSAFPRSRRRSMDFEMPISAPPCRLRWITRRERALFFLVLMIGSVCAVSPAGNGLFPAGGRGPDAASRAGACRHTAGTDASVLCPVRAATSAASSEPTKSTSFWTTSACPTAARISRSVTPRPWGRWTVKF